jgi:hypothetical protein
MIKIKIRNYKIIINIFIYKYLYIHILYKDITLALKL